MLTHREWERSRNLGFEFDFQFMHHIPKIEQTNYFQAKTTLIAGDISMFFPFNLKIGAA